MSVAGGKKNAALVKAQKNEFTKANVEASTLEDF